MKKFTACLLLLLCVAAAVATAQYAPRGCMPMRDMTSISFEPGMTQNRRRNPNAPRMNCVGNCPGDAYLAGAQCKQEGLSDNGLPSWHCIGNFERGGDRYTLGNVKVSCEGCEYSGDPNVVLGSCALTYAVKSKNSNRQQQQQRPSHTTTTTTTSSHGGYYSSSDDSTNAIFAFIFIIIVLVIVLSVCCSSSNNQQRDANYRQGYAYGQAPPPPPGPGPYSNNGYAAAQNYQSGFVDGATTASMYGGGYGRRAYYDPPVHHTTHTTTTHHYSGGDNSSSGNSGGGSSNSDNGGGRGGSESL